MGMVDQQVFLNRIILYSGDVEVLKRFYVEHFALIPVEEIKNEWVVLKAGQVEIAFHRAGESYIPTQSHSRAENNVKLVFNTNDLNLFRERLLQAGVPMRPIKSYTGFDYLLCDGEDPEGNIFQLMQITDK
jgi:hypothetical protein